MSSIEGQNIIDAEELSSILRKSVKDSLRGVNECGLMFSGGVDSSVLAVIGMKHCDMTLYTAGAEGSADLGWVREIACIIDMPLKEIVITRQDVEVSLDEVVRRHGISNPKWISTFVAFDMVIRKVTEEVVMCGQGADELFGGYLKYTRTEDPGARMEQDTRVLLEEELPAYKRLAQNNGKVLLAPFLDHNVVHFASGLALERKLGPSGNKIILREAAMGLGVPGMMAGRGKKAMQYGTGVSGLLKSILKDAGQDLEGYIEGIG